MVTTSKQSVLNSTVRIIYCISFSVNYYTWFTYFKKYLGCIFEFSNNVKGVNIFICLYNIYVKLCYRIKSQRYN